MTFWYCFGLYKSVELFKIDRELILKFYFSNGKNKQKLFAIHTYDKLMID